MKKIVFLSVPDWQQKLILRDLSPGEVLFVTDPAKELTANQRRAVEILSVFVDFTLDQKVLEKFPNLKFIATRSTGYDHIDLKECRQKNISVAYVPSYGENTVAEFAFGLILNLTRKMYHAIDQIKRSGSFAQENLRGIDLKEKTIGVIGTGHIGLEVIKIAHGFGMSVLGFVPQPDPKLAKKYNFHYVTLKKLLGASDIITIHCPYNKSTHHLINQKNIKFIKKGAYLINTARGGIVQTEALIQALEKGILAGCGLDVLEEELETKDELKFLHAPNRRVLAFQKILENHALMKMPNVLITPHNAFNSEEAIKRILHTTLENIRAYLKGKPQNLIPERT